MRAARLGGTIRGGWSSSGWPPSRRSYLVGVVGYLLLGLSPLDALYQTVNTVTTVGFGSGASSTAPFQIFTIVLALGGIGTVLYTLSVLLESIVEGRLTDDTRRRRMERNIAAMQDHIIVCGWGRVGRTMAEHARGAGAERGRGRARRRAPGRGPAGPSVEGDATEDAVLLAAGLERARTLVVALDTDADNLYVTLSARALRPDLFIVARARNDSAEPKLMQAGANRVVNPQQIGGARMAALAISHHVADFLDVVMHDGSLEFRLDDVAVPPGSALDATTLREAHLRGRTGALVLAIRDAAGAFRTNPPPDTALAPGDVLIAVGTSDQLAALAELAGGTRTAASLTRRVARARPRLAAPQRRNYAPVIPPGGHQWHLTASAARQRRRSSASPTASSTTGPAPTWCAPPWPTPRAAARAGSYSYRDLLELKLIKTMLDSGIKLESVRQAFAYLRTNLGEDIASARLVIAGSSAVLVRDDAEMIEVVNGLHGQGVLNLNLVTLDGLKGELDAAVLLLRPTADLDLSDGTAPAEPAEVPEAVHRR